MTKIERLLSLSPALVLSFWACSESRQPVTGTVAQGTFVSPVTKVSATRPGADSIDSAVGNDGSFTLNLPPGAGYRVELLGESSNTTLVFPRSSGALQWRFDVVGAGGGFDLGVVRQVGNPHDRTITFAHAKAKRDADGGVAGEGDRDVTCVDGLDPVTGATCVEDDAQALECKGKGGRHRQDQGHGRGEDCDAGCHEHDPQLCDIDAGVCHGAGDHHGGCDGGANDHHNTGTDSSASTAGEAAPTVAAVADRNLPSSLGDCTDGDDRAGRR